MSRPEEAATPEATRERVARATQELESYTPVRCPNAVRQAELER